MRKRVFVLAATLIACAPPIVVPDEKLVARAERKAREVELCVLVQEQQERALWNGVASFDGPPWKQTIASIAVMHPKGILMIDPAFGKSIAEDLHRAGPVVMSVLGDERGKTPLVQVMREAGLAVADVKYAMLTHVHWDHGGALGDLVEARVLISRAELTFAQSLNRYFHHGVMPHHLKRAKERLFAFDFDGPPIDGFPASHDLFGDGSVIAVPQPGHTPGSTAILVRGKGGLTWLFSGDTTWTSRGVELPAHKTFRIVDVDPEALSSSIGLLHALYRHRPDVKVIPAHDGNALSALPRCGAVR